MKYLTYEINNKMSYGVLVDENNILPLKPIIREFGLNNAPDLLSFIRQCNIQVTEDILKALPQYIDQMISLNSVKLLSPIPYPRRNIFCVGKNYAEHAAEIANIGASNSSIPKEPIYFSKVADPAIGDGSLISIRSEFASRLDYEAELVVVIGKDGKDIAEEEADNYIFGYTIGNDISARDIQNKKLQWFKGKSLDNAAVIGPWIVSKDEFTLPLELNISSKVNGEIRQQSNTKNLIFDIAQIISDLSRGLTLRAGDLIMTGTPAGVGIAMNPLGVLKSGDVVECEITGIGTLTNEVRFV